MYAVSQTVGYGKWHTSNIDDEGNESTETGSNINPLNLGTRVDK